MQKPEKSLSGSCKLHAYITTNYPADECISETVGQSLSTVEKENI